MAGECIDGTQRKMQMLILLVCVTAALWWP
jgi:hypothetical protein